MADMLLAGAAAASIVAIGVLRLAWSRPRRSTALNNVGWAMLLAASIIAGVHSGAWGISIAAIFAMAAALLWLAHAALLSPSSPGAKVSNRRVRMLPEGSEPLQLGRRLVTFLMIAVAAALISTAVAIGVRALVLLVGAAEADANVAALAAMPLAWTVLSYVLLMKEAHAAQGRVLLTWAVAGGAACILELIA
ncbi:hypothetical protein [Sphingomonas mucosissima]|uniref:Uncharacterized protein n=1 Tax=Sphingomonas mucosissima TaxID=370959 RepID=A0A245ZLA9_9SPHN|nr:hypothetical protein [Sphingomonas mucosissima]OWK30520.1 hypothetical protein SPMU_15070 [Sphingomonas mucosissima]